MCPMLVERGPIATPDGDIELGNCEAIRQYLSRWLGEFQDFGNN